MRKHLHVPRMDHDAMKQPDPIFCLHMMQKDPHQCLGINSKSFETELGEVPTQFYH